MHREVSANAGRIGARERHFRGISADHGRYFAGSRSGEKAGLAPINQAGAVPRKLSPPGGRRISAARRFGPPGAERGQSLGRRPIYHVQRAKSRAGSRALARRRGRTGK